MTSLTERIDHGFEPEGPTNDPPPHRRHRLVLDAHADTRDDLASVLQHIADVLRMRADQPSQTGGGMTSGWHWEHTEDPAMDAGRYFAERQAWRERRRAEAPGVLGDDVELPRDGSQPEQAERYVGPPEPVEMRSTDGTLRRTLGGPPKVPAVAELQRVRMATRAWAFSEEAATADDVHGGVGVLWVDLVTDQGTLRIDAVAGANVAMAPGEFMAPQMTLELLCPVELVYAKGDGTELLAWAGSSATDLLAATGELDCDSVLPRPLATFDAMYTPGQLGVDACDPAEPDQG